MKGYNPARPHSLRAAFRSRLTGKIDGDLIEFFMGHEIGEQKRAYINLPTEELRELYMDAERYLAVEKTSREEIAERKSKLLKVSNEYEKRIEKLETTIGVLQAQNTDLNNRVELALEKIENVEALVRKLGEVVE